MTYAPSWYIVKETWLKYSIDLALINVDQNIEKKLVKSGIQAISPAIR